MKEQSYKGIDYLEKAPAGDGPARQLVFLFHGFGFNARATQSLADEIAARLPHAKIIMPHGLEPYALIPAEPGNVFKTPQQLDEASQNNNRRRQWFSLHGDWTDIQPRLSAAAQRLNEWIDAERDCAGLADKDIAIMGFSQGGATALYTAFSRAASVGCAVGHSTFFHITKELKVKPQTLFVYGDADEEFPAKLYNDMTSLLRGYLGAGLDVEKVAGLGHKTDGCSRKIVADYIVKKLAP